MIHDITPYRRTWHSRPSKLDIVIRFGSGLTAFFMFWGFVYAVLQ
jgi:hypothetical protein